MKKKRLKIKFGLFLSLVLILGTLLGLYLGFCKGGSYNKIEIQPKAPAEETPSEEAPSEEPSSEEAPPAEQPPEEEIPAEPVSEEQTEAEEKISVDWGKYNPEENLAGENWALTLISSKYPIGKAYSPSLETVTDSSSVTADGRVAEAYKKMYAAAAADGLVLTPYSGYCNYQRQQSLFDSKADAFVLQGKTKEEAEAEASKRVERGGCSENNAGLAVDIISASAGFASTKEYSWLTENAHKYGFVLRYPENKTEVTGMIFQPWHWRFVGAEAAAEMKAKNLCLEEYLKAE